MQQRWKERFAEILNRPNPEREAEVTSHMEIIEEIRSGPIAKAEIRSAILSVTAGKASGEECITVQQLLKAYITTTVDMLHDLVPADWRRKGLNCQKRGSHQVRKLAGISLVSVVAKVMGKVLIRRMSEFILETNYPFRWVSRRITRLSINSVRRLIMEQNSSEADLSVCSSSRKFKNTSLSP